MIRFALSAIAVAAVVAMAHPASADPRGAAASDHSPVAAAASEQPSSAVAGWSSSPDPVTAGHGTDVPVGFGWG